jgi:Protein of unknown function (DUF4031)
MLYVTKLTPCQRSEKWPYDESSYMIADTHEELWKARRYFALKPEWVQAEGTHKEHFDLTPKKFERVVREWAKTGRVQVISLKEAGRILAEKKKHGIV